MSKTGRQLELPLPRVGAAERRAFIRRRLQGLEHRQNAREAKRQASYKRRRAREAGLLEEPASPQQLVLAGTDAKNATRTAKQLPLPIAPFWTL